MPRFRVQLCQQMSEFAPVIVEAESVEDITDTVLNDLWVMVDDAVWDTDDDYTPGTHLVENEPTVADSRDFPVYVLRHGKLYKETVICDRCGAVVPRRK